MICAKASRRCCWPTPTSSPTRRNDAVWPESGAATCELRMSPSSKTCSSVAAPLTRSKATIAVYGFRRRDRPGCRPDQPSGPAWRSSSWPRCSCGGNVMMSITSVVIVGAGLGGLSAACHLAGAGYDVTVLERADEPRVAVRGGCDMDGYVFRHGADRVDDGGHSRRHVFAAAGTSMDDHLPLHRLDPAYPRGLRGRLDVARCAPVRTPWPPRSETRVARPKRPASSASVGG